jgi:hypothetical protein
MKLETPVEFEITEIKLELKYIKLSSKMPNLEIPTMGNSKQIVLSCNILPAPSLFS